MNQTIEGYTMPINFKTLTTQAQAEKGYCLLRDSDYATIDAKQVHNSSRRTTYRKAHWRCDEEGGRTILRILDGVTGHESWYIDNLIDCGLFDEKNEWICACAGTYGRWDELWLNTEQVKGIVQKYCKDAVL